MQRLNEALCASKDPSGEVHFCGVKYINARREVRVNSDEVVEAADPEVEVILFAL